jgi:hypothetical protein
MKILSSSNKVALSVLSPIHAPIMIELKGIMDRIRETPSAIRLGMIAYAGIPLGEKLAQVKLPKV